MNGYAIGYIICLQGGESFDFKSVGRGLGNLIGSFIFVTGGAVAGEFARKWREEPEVLLT